MAPERLPIEALRMLAVDAIEVSQWAIRMGMKREQQVDEIVRAFEVTLGYREAERPTHHANGAPMFAPDGGTMLDDKGNRSIFDDIDK